LIYSAANLQERKRANLGTAASESDGQTASPLAGSSSALCAGTEQSITSFSPEAGLGILIAEAYPPGTSC